jgi:hypothetical protein
VTVVDDETKISKKYKMACVEPTFRKSSIYGAGTVVWVVEDPESGEEVLIKDYWRGDGEEWVSECRNLKAARGLDGVVQMILCEEDRCQTKDFAGYWVYDSQCVNFIHSRMVMEKYGDHLFNFSSEKHLLCAVRDAIAGELLFILSSLIVTLIQSRKSQGTGILSRRREFCSAMSLGGIFFSGNPRPSQETGGY